MSADLLFQMMTRFDKNWFINAVTVLAIALEPETLVHIRYAAHATAFFIRYILITDCRTSATFETSTKRKSANEETAETGWDYEMET